MRAFQKIIRSGPRIHAVMSYGPAGAVNLIQPERLKCAKSRKVTEVTAGAE